MKSILVEAIINGKATVDIGKYTKDGKDLDYALKLSKFDEYTGEEVEIIDHSISVAQIEAEIQSLTKELDNMKALQVTLADDKIPVIADYTVVVEPESNPEPPFASPYRS